jgi:hypothetical protein
MPEVVGTCKSADANAIWIVDDDGDDIEMSMDRLPEAMVHDLVQSATQWIGQRVSYYYDSRSIQLRKVDATEPALPTVFCTDHATGAVSKVSCATALATLFPQ